MALYCELENIITESDVEQKFIYPFRSFYKELHADHETGAADNK